MIDALKSAGRWAWAICLAVFAIFAVIKFNLNQKRAAEAEQRIDNIEVDDMEQRHRDIEKDIDRANKARKRAAEAKVTAERRLDELGNTQPDVGDLMDRYRAAGVHDATDASRN